ncbi:hypothetical protein BKM31_43960 [[Actinomadura] parvosata subsp. kistnae]|uniref:Uncharacterized protein n=1 Tax=[Actinomadura] parvosata subsp. kistnae TaxID=1909395 RepID=A0A1V0ABE9_9ACTN|nr:hypothetical protein [Nonomuraea sp. ATCC 55076]AQZ67499.1 hypothetical protein BKM31_43960 [Nonomuraea sp. ATCC 55076]
MEADVLSRWRRRSMAAGWSLAEDWWTPEVEGVIKAVCAGCGLAQACWELGSARAAAGIGVAEGMNDLAALFAVTGTGEPPFTALRSFAAGWAEHGFAPLGELHCEDPLTGLATPAYLRTRLAQLYRGTAKGTCLVAAEPSAPPLELAERLAAALNLATALRRAFPGDETLALLGPVRVGAVTRMDEVLRDKLARLGSAEILYGRRPRVRVRPLPKAYGQALALIRSLGS